MAEWAEVATLKDLKRRKRLLVTVGTEEIALFLINDGVFALKDACIHKGRSLSKGTVFHGKVICPGHQWQFEVGTGWVEDQEQCQPTYAVKVEDEKVYVDPQPRQLMESAPMPAEL